MAGRVGNPDVDADVLIVGHGPVGQLLSVLLAQRGWRVAVVERWPRPYPLPRAVAFDGESARILASAGIGGHIRDFGEPSGDYAWLNADGKELLHYDAFDADGLSGWPDSTSMYQPGLEAALVSRCIELGVRVCRGFEATELVEHPDHVALSASGRDGTPMTLRASWVVGCDGASSFVRRQMGTQWTDLGFRHDWLICDVVSDPPREYIPNNLQICDPARPRTAVSAGPGHRRFEFMLVDGETPEEMNDKDHAWDLLGTFGVHQDNTRMERHAVYTFEARYADDWRSGRLLIAGDAAHLMPPFAAQGMSSGFRDAANVAWKLHFVLAGLAGDALLDSYTIERRQHVQHAIEMSVSLGKVICQTDPQAVADRDALMLAMRERARYRPTPQPSAVTPLRGGVLHGESGDLTPQAQVCQGGRTALLDDIVGPGFVVLTATPPADLLDAGDRMFLHRIGAVTSALTPATAASQADPADLVDVNNVYLPYLDKLGAVAAVIRPDRYLYGTAPDRAGLAALLTRLRDQLHGGH
jgi:flavoprotein hydroxylase